MGKRRSIPDAHDEHHHKLPTALFERACVRVCVCVNNTCGNFDKDSFERRMRLKRRAPIKILASFNHIFPKLPPGGVRFMQCGDAVTPTQSESIS